MGFYLTYEEWKQANKSTNTGRLSRFYLTYEEWKLGTNTAIAPKKAVFLSYL